MLPQQVPLSRSGFPVPRRKLHSCKKMTTFAHQKVNKSRVLEGKVTTHNGGLAPPAENRERERWDPERQILKIPTFNA